jgi:hypothetical protein
VKITNITFFDVAIVPFLIKRSNIIILTSTFNQSASAIDVNEFSNIQVDNCKFIELNSAVLHTRYNGGAIYSRNSNISISNTLFNHNIARNGGSFYFICDINVI